MHIYILTIGKLNKSTPEYQLIADYIKKTKWPISIQEYTLKKLLPPDETKKAESALLLSAIPSGGKVIVLDETGKSPTSRQFAALLQQYENTATPHITFIIGGANGHTQQLREKADYLLSFGTMTLPHMLARVVLSEQLYRAHSILTHHPYHRD